MNASKTTRKWMNATTVMLLIFIAVDVFFIPFLMQGLMQELHLMRSGIVTRGTVVRIESVNCGGGDGGDEIGSTCPAYYVRFTDNKGRTWVENICCDSFYFDEWSVGDSITILYAPDDPTVIAVQDRFADKVQEDEDLAVFVGVITIGMILAILLIQLIRYLMILRERGLSQGNRLLALVSKNEVVASFIDSILCRTGIHQGEWTRTGCQLSRYCIFCGKPQDREGHNWPPKAFGRYFKDGSCEKRVKCLDCEETKSIGVDHEGRTSWWNAACKRCGESLGGD